jgi:2-oxoglutarate dehydrogenase E2 component (dihydrolipoamide succinyltransferase)
MTTTTGEVAGAAGAATMTERPRRFGPAVTIAAAAATFLAALAFLAGQVRAGKDPAIGPARETAAATTATAGRPVVRRRVVITRVVHDAPTAGAPVPAPAPAPAGPAPAPAPAPAAPAPVVTRAS